MRVTESRLRRVIRQVIRESYEFPTKRGMELLEKIYMDMVPIGGQYNPLMDSIKSEYKRKCGSCVSCEVFDVTKTGEGASFGVKSENGQECQMVLRMSSFGGPEIIVELLELKEGDQVRVLHVERPYSGTRQDWGGCEGIVDSINIESGVCTIIDLQGQLRPLVDCPMTREHLELVSSDSSGIDSIRDHISDTVNQDMPMESVLRRVIRKELKRR